MNTIKITQEIPFERIQDLLCNALEGGSNHWYEIKKYLYPVGETKESLNIEFEHLELPFKNGIIVFGDLEDPKREDMLLGLPTIAEGLQIMADKFPRHFANFLMEDDDAETGDVFLQCCLFKDVIYG